ncbi:MAG: hypothetical protein COV10_02305 [Candidatus Vogelbacteria bacterium CG10_big_fil_rev_8_21_14_0_10_51_16]|uniref:DNA 3'-5' helicase n=1 Tax=Candidatus Vogelbacteria bacterium CG10_big_fil_rev_8_21_14_0_10_51_16 TaxID=1975045 RepID=A0A2H0RGG0_9BACT|nr:MAG: hypothetical protein COV10_02305 [Candidatus Vogelbacteria bacterium CG10_big_fil_rev_8_21_14_0_10_51_16]
MQSGEFEKQYKALTPTQREAVDAIEGPVMVVAGPGTGKTQILTLRIANILQKTDTAPEQILALTFTESGVLAMRRRLLSFIGEAAYSVAIHTFHGFCNTVIARFSAHFPALVGSETISELDRILLMQKVFDEVRPESLSSFRSPYHYVSKALSAISNCKRENISPDALEARAAERLAAITSAPDYRHEKGAHKGKVCGEYKKEEEQLVRVSDLGSLYHDYEAALAEAQTYDFDDMILAVVRTLESDVDLKLILQEEYQYLLADEHQDANGAQNRVLELMADFHSNPNIFVVGDEKQAIYRFQGASLANFLSFREHYPEARLVSLIDNFRSPQAVLDLAHGFIGNESASPLPRPRLLSLTKIAGETRLVTLTDPDQEAAWVAEDTKVKIKAGAVPEEIVLFTRTNKELARFGAALARLGVPYSLETKEDVLDDPLIERLLLLLRAVADFGEESALVRAMHVDTLQIDELAIYELALRAAKERQPLVSLACSPTAPPDILSFCKKLKGWASFGANHSMAELVSLVVREAELLPDFLARPEVLAKLRVLLTFLEEHQRTHRTARLAELLESLRLMDEYNILKASGSALPGRVQLMTAHRGKGLGFRHVYITGLQDGVWGSRQSKTTFKIPGIAPTTKAEEEADERRLFYVAMTRVKESLTLSYAESREDGKEAFLSMYLSELDESLLRKEKVASSLELATARFAPPMEEQPDKKEFQRFVRETLLERGLSVTHLNNYLECPWRWFYRNLLRVPEPQNKHLMFGNAVHATLQWFFDARTQGKISDIRYQMSSDLQSKQSGMPGKPELLARLERELARQAFTETELVDAEREGAKALAGYYDEYVHAWTSDIENEKAVDVILKIEGLDIPLNGKLDKIEKRDDGTVNVVDYKTGKPKSENFILGKTADSNGDYHRQLVFYKLLLDRYEDGRYKMTTGEIDFVEPDKKSGKYKKLTFEITKGETRELEELVKKSVEEMLSLSFWNKRCDDKLCEGCSLRSINGD